MLSSQLGPGQAEEGEGEEEESLEKWRLEKMEKERWLKEQKIDEGGKSNLNNYPLFKWFIHCYIKCPFLGLGASFGQFSSNVNSFHLELIFAIGLEF